VSEKVTLEVPSELPIYSDQKIALEDLASGDSRAHPGREVVREVQGKEERQGAQGPADPERPGDPRRRRCRCQRAYREGRDKGVQWYKAEVKMSTVGSG